MSVPDSHDFEAQHEQVGLWRDRIVSPTPSGQSDRSPERRGSPAGSFDSHWDMLETTSSAGSRVESLPDSDDEYLLAADVD